MAVNGSPERSNHAEIQQEFKEEGGEGDARIQARQVEERPGREQGKEPQAGDRHRVVAGAALGCKGANSKVLFAQFVQPEPERSEPQSFDAQIHKPEVQQPDEKIGAINRPVETGGSQRR